MGLDATRFEAEGLEQAFADQVRGLAGGATYPQIDTRFPEIDRQQLGMAVGEVQQMHIAEARQLVEAVALAGRPG
jgi:hypothetical protein